MMYNTKIEVLIDLNTEQPDSCHIKLYVQVVVVTNTKWIKQCIHGKIRKAIQYVDHFPPFFERQFGNISSFFVTLC